MKKSYKEIVLYLVFGVLTTLINVLAYSMLYYGLSVSNTLSVIISWILSVLFAFVTNRTWVFCGNKKSPAAEALEFFVCRLFTGILDLTIMYIGVEVMNFEGAAVKILSNIIVVLLNYVLSKLYIFK